MTRNFGADGDPFSVTKLRTLDNAHDAEGVVSGCDVTPGTNNFDTDVASGVVNVNGSRVSVAAETVTHSTSGAEDRVDLITVDSTDTKTVTEGAQASTSGQPNAPDIPTDEVLLALVHVRGGSTEILAGDILTEYAAQKEEIEDYTTAGSAGTVPVAQSDGSLSMESEGFKWVEDANSPLTLSSSTSETITLGSDYEAVKLIFTGTGSNNRVVSLRANGDTGTNYNYVNASGSETTGVNRVEDFGRELNLTGTQVVMSGKWSGNFVGETLGIYPASTNAVHFTNGNITSPLDSITILNTFSNALTLTAHVYGWNP